MRRLAPLALAAVASCSDWESLSREGASACVAYVVAGDTHTCARLADGSLRCWGDNRFGQLGTGDKNPRGKGTVALGGALAAKVFLPAGDGDVTADQAVFSCAIMTDNTLSCWGDNRFGQLGTGDKDPRLAPARVGALGAEISKATNGAGHTCAQTADGALYCWGKNTAGQLGLGDTQPRLLPEKVPIPVVVDRLSAGGSFTCARGADSSLFCFGANEHGQLGLGSTAPQSTPQAIASLAGQVVRLSTGAAHACAFTTDGSLFCWGDNRHGQLGTGDTGQRTSPVKIGGGDLGSVTQIFAGGTHTCALRVDGALFCWGDNRFGQLGSGDTDARATPAPVDALGASVASAYAGGAHTCAVKLDGSVWCWGNNQYRQLGVDVGPIAKAPVQVLPPCK